MSVIFDVINPAFLSPENMSNFFAYFPELGLMALPMTYLLIAGEFDLSVGSIFAFGPVLMFTLYNKAGVPIIVAFVITMVACAFVGLVNGWFVTKIGVSSFLTTVGMSFIIRGACLTITNGFPQSSWKNNSALRPILTGSVTIGNFEVLASLLWFALFFVVMLLVLNRTKLGNWIFATGGNVRAARALGIDTDRLKIGLFMLSALMASLAGTIDAFRISAVYPVAGQGYEMEVVAMVVIGGTSLFGGSGTLVGTLIGVTLLRAVRNGIIVIGVPGMAYQIFVGAIILAMMALHATMEKRTGKE